MTFLFFLVLKLNSDNFDAIVVFTFSVLFERRFQGRLYNPNTQQLVKVTDIMTNIIKSRVFSGKNQVISMQTQGIVNIKVSLVEYGSGTIE